MAAGTLPEPGSKHGPCADPCAHTDCAETRRMAETPCHVCGKPIGYERPFYREGLTLSHAACLEDSIYAIGKAPSK